MMALVRDLGTRCDHHYSYNSGPRIAVYRNLWWSKRNGLMETFDVKVDTKWIMRDLFHVELRRELPAVRALLGITH